MSFLGKRVLVTGGAKGLGKAIVEKFLEAGATVVALDNDAKALTLLKAELPQVVIIEIDLQNWNSVELTISKLDAFHHLVNNAGVMVVQPALEITEENVDSVFGVNFKAALHLSQIFAKQVVANSIKGATIVNVSSTSVLPGALQYCCSKAALLMMTKCLAKEFGPMEIRVNAIRPTAMDTNVCQTFKKSIPDGDTVMLNIIGKAPIPRYLETHEAADLVIFLSSPAAAMITGEDIAIDGGFSIM